MKISKHILGVFTLGVVAFSLTSCQSDSDFLKEHSYTFDDSGMFNTENELQMGLNSCYQKVNYLILGQTHGYHSYMITGVGLDTYGENSTNDQFADWSAFKSNSGYARHWYNELYYLVNRANTVIDNVESKDITYSTDTKRGEILGEARFMRGWAYRCLAAMFGNVPILDHATKEVNMGYQPNNRQAVWEFCKEDFEYAANNMAKTERAAGCVTRAAADHMLAEICLALGQFDEAISAATRVIDGSDGDYHLMTTRFGSDAASAKDRYGHDLSAAKGGAYWDLFRSGNQDYSAGNKEALWTSQYSYGDYSVGGSGDAWWRMRNNTMEGDFMSNKVRYAGTTRTLTDGTVIYLFGDDAACYVAGISGGSGTLGTSTTARAAGRYLANNTRDSLGGGYGYGNNRNYPCRYVYDSKDPNYLWKKGVEKDASGNVVKEDIRGSETMMQHNWYTPAGTRWLDAYKEARRMSDLAEAGKADKQYILSGGDTIDIFPRFWKFTALSHGGDVKSYDYEPYMIRLAETYLLRAEAYLAKGNTQKAADDINVIRDRANAPRVTAAEVDIDYILDERTRELFGEEHRIVTLNRLSVNPNCGSYVTTKYPTQDETTSNTLYERVRKYGLSYVNVTKAVNEEKGRMWDAANNRYIPNIKPYNYQYPIPDDVISSNSGAEYPQNTGY